jgi:hypothetical protein
MTERNEALKRVAEMLFWENLDSEDLEFVSLECLNENAMKAQGLIDKMDNDIFLMRECLTAGNLKLAEGLGDLSDKRKLCVNKYNNFLQKFLNLGYPLEFERIPED